jgi:DNA-binding NarL/FixJ family response regulator
MTQLHKVFLGLFFLIVTIFSSHEVYDELKEINGNKTNFTQAGIEIIFVILSFSAMIYFIYMLIQQSKNQRELEANLAKVKQQLETSNIKLRDGKKEYQEIIQWQFREWSLSPSEKEVALLMLKGLSIRKISQSRSTQEKTVRKQASSIYEKSNLGGRHELSAWFFENLL